MNRFPEALNNHAPAGNPPCECGHEYEDHEVVHDEVYEADTGRWSIEATYMVCVRGCPCHEYREFDEYAAAEEASLRRAEMRGEWRT